MNAVCPYCEKSTEINPVTMKETHKIKGLSVTIPVEHSVCAECGRDFATKEQMERATKAGYDAYREAEGIVSPEEIIRIREKYSASQKVFAKILDLGDLTINSYEQGALVSKSISNLIRFMENPDNFTELLNKKRNEFSKTQIQRIEKALESREVSMKESRLLCSADRLENMAKVSLRFTGNNRPDPEKILRLIQMIILRAGKELYKMAVLKILFYIDFTAFKRMTLSITGWPYARLPLGPVPNEYKDLLCVGEDNSYLVSRPDDNDVGELYGVPDSVEAEKVIKIFDDSQIEIIQMVVDALKDKTPTELKDLTHKEKAWIETSHAAFIDYHLANELILF